MESKSKVGIKDIKEMFRAQRERTNRALAHRQMVKDLKEEEQSEEADRAAVYRQMTRDLEKERQFGFAGRGMVLNEHMGVANTVGGLNTCSGAATYHQMVRALDGGLVMQGWAER